MNNAEQARKSIRKHITKTQNEDVLRSILLIMGDCEHREDGEERARYITAILFGIIECTELKSLEVIQRFAKALAKLEAGA